MTDDVWMTDWQAYTPDPTNSHFTRYGRQLMEKPGTDFAKIFAIFLQIENIKTMYLSSLDDPERANHLKATMMDLISELPPETGS